MWIGVRGKQKGCKVRRMGERRKRGEKLGGEEVIGRRTGEREGEREE